MKCRDVITKLELLSPPSFALEWDNSGMMVGRKDKDVHSVMLALDATDEVLKEAIFVGVDMLITHHPLMFRKVNCVTDDTIVGRRVLQLAQRDMVCYAMHTNFDVMGMADAAADRIGLKNREVLEVTYEDDISKEGIGRYGFLPQTMTLCECAQMIKETFSLDYVRVFGEDSMTMVSAAISTGSGRSMIEPALASDVDVLITGDIDYHSGLDALAQGLAIIDAGHFGLEKIFMGYMQDYFQRELPDVAVFISKQGEAEHMI